MGLVGVNNNNNCSNGGCGHSSNNSSICFYDMGLKCWCRRRKEKDNKYCVLSSSVIFFIGSFLFFGSIALLYGWVFLPAYDHRVFINNKDSSLLGCQEDNEGSWSIGVFYGDSPFSLQPVDSMNVWKNESAAWPVANPVVTCSSASSGGFPSNFVADPFIYVQDDTLYMFYETKNSITLQGDIGVAKSSDKGVTWQHLGIALDEDWHLSYPYVFNYLGEIYMTPEGSQTGELRLYRAIDFPLQWKLENVILKRPLVDSFIIFHDGMYWLFGSDHSGFGVKKNGQLEIWYSDSPLGPWKPHKKNPVYNTDKSSGARNGGRPFTYNGFLYRIGQDCGETYGRRVRIFKVLALTKNDFKEVEVLSGIEEANKGRNAWNGARYHHLDVQQLSSGMWIGVMDGDRVPSGDTFDRLVLGWTYILLLIGLVVLLGVLLGAVRCIIPLNWFPETIGKRSDTLLDWERSNLGSSRLRRLYTRLNRAPLILRGMVKLNTHSGKLIVVVMYVLGMTVMCLGVGYIFGGNGAQEAYHFNGHYSQFTMLTMTYDARMWNLKMYVKHYSRCSSVKEIVVVWNKGTPPKLTDFDSTVPVRIRVEKQNSLNNRFRIDPLIKTRAVLELDDDIMMTCDDIERGFRVWREHPDCIVGFYPRLSNGSPLKYRAEKYARTHKGYNMILTGAAFLDSQFAFQKYWSEEVKEGRQIVDKYFNCEDVLMNYLYANSSSQRAVEYVRPAWAIDTSKFSGVAISRNTQNHYQIRSECLSKFSEMYGSLAHQKWGFNQHKYGWDV